MQPSILWSYGSSCWWLKTMVKFFLLLCSMQFLWLLFSLCMETFCAFSQAQSPPHTRLAMGLCDMLQEKTCHCIFMFCTTLLCASVHSTTLAFLLIPAMTWPHKFSSDMILVRSCRVFNWTPSPPQAPAMDCHIWWLDLMLLQSFHQCKHATMRLWIIS